MSRPAGGPTQEQIRLALELLDSARAILGGATPTGGSADQEFLTLDQFADYLQVPKLTVYRWRRDGTGPSAHKIGRSLRFRMRDVEAWLVTRQEDR